MQSADKASSASIAKRTSAQPALVWALAGSYQLGQWQPACCWLCLLYSSRPGGPGGRMLLWGCAHILTNQLIGLVTCPAGFALQCSADQQNRAVPCNFEGWHSSAAHVLQVFDVRMQREMQSYRGHNRDVICATWHPVHEDLFASGAYDGSLIIWQVASPHPEVSMQQRPPSHA